MNWYIGQEVVCVKTHPKGLVKKDQVYIIKGLRGSICACDSVEIDVGFSSINGGCICTICNKRYNTRDDGIFWFSESRFAPLMDISELESILKKETINK